MFIREGADEFILHGSFNNKNYSIATEQAKFNLDFAKAKHQKVSKQSFLSNGKVRANFFFDGDPRKQYFKLYLR